MKNVEKVSFEYYLDLDHQIVYVYEENVDFFDYFDKTKQDWVTSKTSSAVVFHDYMMKKLSKEEAYKLTNGVLPDKKYKEFCDLIEKNLTQEDDSIDWDEVDKESKRCLKICMEMDELDKNS